MTKTYPQNEGNTEGTERNDTAKQRVTWNNTLEFVVSLVGFTSGMADFWRIPFLIWRNGGGAFVIAFVATLFICVAPLYFLEVFIGQYSGRGVFEIWAFAPLFKGIGIAIALLNLLYGSYVSTMRYWLLEYLRQSFTTELPWTSCGNPWNTNSCIVSTAILSSGAAKHNYTSAIVNSTDAITYRIDVSAEEEFWQYNILSLSSGIEEVGSLRWSLVLWAILIKVIVSVSLLKSVKSIGKMMLFATFFPPLIGLAMLIQSLTMDGATDGLLFLITPDFTKLTESKVWIEAAFMAFYSVGPGWGGILVMGSHLKFHSNCLRDVMIGVIGDVIISLFGSVVLFAVIGVMANEMGVPIEQVVKSGMSLGLVGYSRALSFLPMPTIWAVLFFFAVVVVGLDSQIVCTETVVSYLEEFETKIGRYSHVYLVLLVNLITLLLNLPFCTQGGPYMFQLVDWYLPPWSVVIIALLEIIAFMWFYGGDRVDFGLLDMIGRKMPHLIRLAAAYITPFLVMILLLISFSRYQPPKYGSYEYPEYTLAIGWSISLLTVIPIPLYIVWRLTRLKGTLAQRWTMLTKPGFDWGPSGSAKRLEYLDQSLTERTFTDKAFYNLTGRVRYNTERHSETIAMC